MEHTPKNILIRAVRKSGPQAPSEELSKLLQFLHADPSLKRLLETPERTDR